ncbi:hypothetical protein HPP92_009447 [Vanilla planifolia]|uniref:DUF642 domain-containing protein n=1 Tax=Vanilla planifolia TaxID=51239 RepID=A0A835RJT6_VANPL|nr:hypothetical protein HPP92_009447 [Vanilla planifolia]
METLRKDHGCSRMQHSVYSSHQPRRGDLLLPGWIVESNRAVRYIDSDHYTVPQGRRAIELLSGKEGIISQMVETKPEKQYSLVFAMGSAGDSCQPPWLSWPLLVTRHKAFILLRLGTRPPLCQPQLHRQGRKDSGGILQCVLQHEER